MHTTGENAPEDNPQIGCRAKQDAHDGTKDGARSCDVKELHEINFPRGHGLEVHTVSLGVAWCFALSIWSEHTVDDSTVNEVAQDKGYEANNKRGHRRCIEG